MFDSVTQLIERDLRAVERKDLEAVLKRFTADGVLHDPHYPLAEMRGHDEIRYGLSWAFETFESLSFRPRTFLESPDGKSAAVEVDSKYVLVGGRVLEFTQVFVAEVLGDKIVRLESYQSHGPHGVNGFLLRRSIRRYRRRHPRP